MVLSCILTQDGSRTDLTQVKRNNGGNLSNILLQYHIASNKSMVHGIIILIRTSVRLLFVLKDQYKPYVLDHLIVILHLQKNHSW